MLMHFKKNQHLASCSELQQSSFDSDALTEIIISVAEVCTSSLPGPDLTRSELGYLLRCIVEPSLGALLESGASP